MFWIGALIVVVLFGAIAWWSSGRTRAGVDDSRVQRLGKKSEGSTGYYDGGGG